jgi:hypothetical protein
MSPDGAREDSDGGVVCPRCRYNLRGLTVARCPECGLTFSAEEWAAGVLRENVRTWLDRCDPWQPHQVLIRSLYELVRGALRPGWVISKLDLGGPLWAAGLMLGCGAIWLYVLTVMLVGAATVVHTGASPAAALRWAGLVWGPRIVAVAFLSAAAVLGMLRLLRVPRALKLGWREQVRLVGYWVPSAAAWAVVPVATALLVAGNVAMEFWRPWPLGAGLPVVVGLVRELRRQRALRLGLCAVLLVAWAWGCPALARALLPGELEVGMWVYGQA